MNLRGFVKQIKDYTRYLLQKVIWVVLGILIIAGIFVVREYSTEIKYTSYISFMINEDDNSNIGGVGSILGQFGLGGSAGSEYNLDKIVELSRSRRLMEEVILDSIEVEEGRDLVGNIIIDAYELHDDWGESKNKQLPGYYFPNTSSEEFKRTDNFVLGIIYRKLVGNVENNISGLISAKYNNDTGILKISSSTLVEELSLELTMKLYAALSEFYVEKSTEKQRETLGKLEGLVDSVRLELSKVEYQIASFQDRSLGLLRQSDRVKKVKLERDARVLNIMYAEAVKNRETSRFMLQSATPFFQVIDAPVYPLAKRSKHYLKEGIIGGFFGGVLAVIFLCFGKAYRDIMSEE